MNYKQHKRHAEWRRCVTLVAVFTLVSCKNEDRVVTVTCAPAPHDSMSVDIGLSSVNGASTALLNTPQFRPGALIELRPAEEPGYPHGTGNVVYMLRTSATDFLRLKAEVWTAKVVNGKFGFQLDGDPGESARLSNSDWEDEISRSTVLGIASAKRKSLRDPLGLIAANAQVVELFRKAAIGHRFALVTGVSYGEVVDLAYDRPTIAMNTIEVNDLYLHIKYSCAPVVQMKSLIQSSGREVPILFFYIAVKYDSKRDKVVIDKAPLDLTLFDVSRAMIGR